MEQGQSPEVMPVYGEDAIILLLQMRDVPDEQIQATIAFFYDDSPVARPDKAAEEGARILAEQYRYTDNRSTPKQQEHGFTPMERRLFHFIFPEGTRPAMTIVQTLNFHKNIMKEEELKALGAAFNSGLPKIWYLTTHPEASRRR